MATPLVPAQNFTQFNYVLGDTNQVITKQTGFNQSLESFQAAINEVITAFNGDVAFVEQAREELNADNIVHAPGSGLPNAAGEAYSRDVVGGPGDLMARGAFGIGELAQAPYPSSTLNDLTVPTGFYRVESTVGGIWPKAPFNGHITVFRTTETAVIQELVELGISPQKWFRKGTSSGFTPWREIYNTANIVGIVSQSDGVPTGAIIERGSNANGEYVKFADGTLISTVRVTFDTLVTFGSGTFDNPYRSDAYSWTFPHPYSSPPKLSALVGGGSAQAAARCNYATVNSIGNFTASQVQVVRTTSSAEANSVFLTLTAVGTWY